MTLKVKLTPLCGRVSSPEKGNAEATTGLNETNWKGPNQPKSYLHCSGHHLLLVTLVHKKGGLTHIFAQFASKMFEIKRGRLGLGVGCRRLSSGLAFHVKHDRYFCMSALQ